MSDSRINTSIRPALNRLKSNSNQKHNKAFLSCAYIMAQSTDWSMTEVTPVQLASKLIVPPMPTKDASCLVDTSTLYSELDPDIHPGFLKKIQQTFPTENNSQKLRTMAACLSWLCQFDDYTEILDYAVLKQLLIQCQSMLDRANLESHEDYSDFGLVVTCKFIRQLRTLWSAHLDRIIPIIEEMLCGFQEEADFKLRDQRDIELYRQLRRRTISVQPFFEILAVGALPDCLGSQICEQLQTLENEVIGMVGLQNDILGLQKDLRDKKFLNYPVMYARSHGNKDLDAAICAGIMEHNQASHRADKIHQELRICDIEVVRRYADQVYSFSATHLHVFMKSSRYQLQSGSMNPQSHSVNPLKSETPAMRPITT